MKAIADEIRERMRSSRAAKPEVREIDGTLVFGLEFKKAYYPTKQESEMVVVLD